MQPGLALGAVQTPWGGQEELPFASMGLSFFAFLGSLFLLRAAFLLGVSCVASLSMCFSPAPACCILRGWKRKEQGVSAVPEVIRIRRSPLRCWGSDVALPEAVQPRRGTGADLRWESSEQRPLAFSGRQSSLQKQLALQVPAGSRPALGLSHAPLTGPVLFPQ